MRLNNELNRLKKCGPYETINKHWVYEQSERRFDKMIESYENQLTRHSHNVYPFELIPMWMDSDGELLSFLQFVVSYEHIWIITNETHILFVLIFSTHTNVTRSSLERDSEDLGK